MPILHAPGVMMPGQFGPMSRPFLPSIERRTRTMSITGMPSVMHTTSDSSASNASRIESAAPRRRDEDAGSVGASLLHGFSHRIEDRHDHLLAVGTLRLELLAAAVGRDAGDDLRAVGDALLGVKGARGARDPGNQDLGVFIDQNCHALLPSSRSAHGGDDLLRAVGHRVRGLNREPAVFQNLLAELHVRAF